MSTLIQNIYENNLWDNDKLKINCEHDYLLSLNTSYRETITDLRIRLKEMELENNQLKEILELNNKKKLNYNNKYVFRYDDNVYEDLTQEVVDLRTIVEKGSFSYDKLVKEIKNDPYCNDIFKKEISNMENIIKKHIEGFYNEELQRIKKLEKIVKKKNESIHKVLDNCEKRVNVVIQMFMRFKLDIISCVKNQQDIFTQYVKGEIKDIKRIQDFYENMNVKDYLENERIGRIGFVTYSNMIDEKEKKEIMSLVSCYYNELLEDKRKEKVINNKINKVKKPEEIRYYLNMKVDHSIKELLNGVKVLSSECQNSKNKYRQFHDDIREDLDYYENIKYFLDSSTNTNYDSFKKYFNLLEKRLKESKKIYLRKIDMQKNSRSFILYYSEILERLLAKNKNMKPYDFLVNKKQFKEKLRCEILISSAYKINEYFLEKHPEILTDNNNLIKRICNLNYIILNHYRYYMGYDFGTDFCHDFGIGDLKEFILRCDNNEDIYNKICYYYDMHLYENDIMEIVHDLEDE